MENRYEEEWEPSGALREALGGVPLQPETGRGGDPARLLAGLRPHLEEALATLESLEWGRGLSNRERVRAGALRMLLARAREVG